MMNINTNHPDTKLKGTGKIEGSGRDGVGRERFILQQAIISSKDKERSGEFCVANKAVFSFPEGLGVS